MKGALKLLRYSYSLVSFLAFLTLLVLYITGKSDLLLRMVAGYMNWCMQGPIWAVFLVFAVASVGCARIIILGFCKGLLKDKGKLSKLLFACLCILFLIVQFAVRILFGMRFR
jgi:hypothetical protein